MRVKVCGIKTLKDALLAIDMGVWALGFNFYPKSPRFISPKTAAEIIAQLPARIMTVGIFVNEKRAMISAIQDQTRIQMVQLHGTETPEYCKQIKLPIIKTIRPKTQADLVKINDYSGLYAMLIDAYTDDQFGGTGTCANWLLAKQVAVQCPTILAGGLNEKNVSSAVSIVKPFAVDVCSGLEQSPGHKSKKKMAKFFSVIGY